MARKNRLINSIAVHFLIGAVCGAIVGGIIASLLASGPSLQFEARVMLFRVPSDETSRAARDYVANAVSRPGFLDAFVRERNIDSAAQSVLSRNLEVTARDPASPNAELKLVGTNEEMLTSTLDELAIYVTETLRTIDEGDMQAKLDELEKEIESVSDKNIDLLNSRDKYEPVADRFKEDIAQTAALTELRKSLELSLRYVLKPLSEGTKTEINTTLEKAIAAQQRRANQEAATLEKSTEDYRFATSLANNSATLKALRQAKQRLVIEFNRDTPLRIASRAKAGLVDVEARTFTKLIPICAFIGALIAGFIWSFLRTRDSRLSGLAIEERFGVPTVAVISQSLTDIGQQQHLPLAKVDAQSKALAGIRSLNVALHLLCTHKRKRSPVIFSELGDGFHGAHVIANLALDMARRGEHCLIIDTDKNDGQLATLFRSGSEQGWVSMITVDGLANPPVATEEKGSICYLHEEDEIVSAEQTTLFDQILVFAPTPAAAKKRFQHEEDAFGVVLCTASTRLSLLRRALTSYGKNRHGAVLCGYAG